MRKSFILLGAAVALTFLWAGSAAAGPIFTRFTGIQDGVNLNPPPPAPGGDPNTIVNTRQPFTLGTPPFTATFAGDGFAFHLGQPPLYFEFPQGLNAWGVFGQGVGTITFDELPAASVTVQARGTPAGQTTDTAFGFPGTLDPADGLLRAFTPDNQLIAEFALSNTGFQPFTFGGPVGRLELENRNGNSFAEIGLFQATPVPEPSSLLLSALAGLVGLGFTAWRRSVRGRVGAPVPG